ncbi:hypothetical protein B0T09DRAFT_407583 [Sordaria sp. MPI-SDFR-AT-0083]|nr:hypothetical protein B0T09DRAFT_407583 [Sordaria sp. MPI-SDFR-AT-0083]
MSAARTNPRSTRQAANRPPPSLRRQDAVIHETVYDQNEQAVNFSIYTDQVMDILNSFFGGRGQVPPPRREVPRLTRRSPYPVRAAAAVQRRNPEDADATPTYTNLPSAGEVTVDIAVLPEEHLPEYSEARQEERVEESENRGAENGGTSASTEFSWIFYSMTF